MPGGIYLIQDDERLLRMDEQAYDSEALLQRLLARYPDLLARRMRLIFVADQIPPELRRVVEFLNQTMNQVEVLAVEIPQYAGEGLRALVPRVIGQVATRPRPRIITDEPTFLSTWPEPHQNKFARLLDLAAEEGLLVKWGTKGFSLNVVLEGKNVSILEGYPPDVYPGLLVVLASIRRKVKDPEPIITWYRDELQKLPAASPTGKGVRIEVEPLDDEQAAQLHEILRGVVGMIREQGLAGE